MKTKINKMEGLPRKWLSWSQISSYEWSKAQYVRSYIYGERKTSPQLELGKRFATAMEFREKGEEQWIMDIVNQIPDPPKREFKASAVIRDIPIIGIYDGFDPKKTIITDEKTGAKPNIPYWKNQQCMYSLIHYLNHKKLPKKNIIYFVPTHFKNDKLIFTGKIQKFDIPIAMEDILIMTNRIVTVYNGIKELCEFERMQFGKLPFDK